jgi:hypothetical protein
MKRFFSVFFLLLKMPHCKGEQEAEGGREASGEVREARNDEGKGRKKK